MNQYRRKVMHNKSKIQNIIKTIRHEITDHDSYKVKYHHKLHSYFVLFIFCMVKISFVPFMIKMINLVKSRVLNEFLIVLLIIIMIMTNIKKNCIKHRIWKHFYVWDPEKNLICVGNFYWRQTLSYWNFPVVWIKWAPLKDFF